MAFLLVGEGEFWIDVPRKIRAEKRGYNRPEVIEQYAQIAEDQFRRSLACEPEVPTQVKLMLGRILVRRNKKAEGAELLKEVMRATDVTERIRQEACALLAEAH